MIASIVRCSFSNWVKSFCRDRACRVVICSNIFLSSSRSSLCLLARGICDCDICNHCARGRTVKYQLSLIVAASAVSSARCSPSSTISTRIAHRAVTDLKYLVKVLAVSAPGSCRDAALPKLNSRCQLQDPRVQGPSCQTDSAIY